MSSKNFNLDKAIRRIPDFPKPGILFYDITSVLANPEAFNFCIEKTVEYATAKGVNAIAAIESRGFIFGAPVASRLNLPLVVIRKKGKLPGETYAKSFTLEYGEDTIEIHKADVNSDQRFLLIDDLIATGGTLKAAIELIEMAQARVQAIAAVIGLPFLNYDSVLSGYEIQTLIDFHSE